MEIRIILTKIITLLYRCRLINVMDNDDLIRTVLNTIKVDSPENIFNGHNIVKNLKDFAIELLAEKEDTAKEVIITRLSIILENDPKLLNVIKEAISPEYDDPTNKRVISSLIKMLNNYYKEHLSVEILSKAQYDLKFNRSKITNFGEYLTNVITNLEPLANLTSTIKDPAVVNELDFENQESVLNVFDLVRSQNTNKLIYKTGWQRLNRMTQGGIRRGEFITIGALQHKYKTGFSLSVFTQIPIHNAPIIMKGEEEKKPLLLRISFEDSLTNNLQFMYQYLKATDGIFLKSKDFENLSTEEMTEYVMKRMTATGFHVKMQRVDPSQWTYMSVINRIIELEAQGYAVHLLMLDYATLLPTTGCVQGPVGSDKKDLVRRIRNFCSARNIIFMTPLQLSSEAKMLVRNGIPEHTLVKDVAEKGYYDGCKSIDQDIDLELFIHLFSHKRSKFISVARGKHRLPTVVDDEDKYFLLKFPGINIPIIGDYEKEDSGYSSLPKDFDDSSSNILDEVFG